jgi:hypothetical protein
MAHSTDAARGPAPPGNEAAAAPDDDLAALRARLAAVEDALGRPGGLGGPAPPTLPALARRVAALERQAGIVPGLVPLAGLPAWPPATATDGGPPPRARCQAWRERGQAALAAALLLALFAWLLRPPSSDGHPGTAPTAQAARATAALPIGAPVPAARPRSALTAGAAPSPMSTSQTLGCPPGDQWPRARGQSEGEEAAEPRCAP